jgi:rod shape-determining protein MreD
VKVVARLTLVVLSTAVLQVGLIAQLPIAGARGMILLLLAIAGGIALGPERGAIVGFVSGLAFDLLLTTPVGLCAFVFSVVGWVAGRYQVTVTRSARWRMVLTAAIGSALGYSALVVVGWLLGQPNMITDRLVVILVVVSLMNAVLCPLAVRVLRWAWDEDERARPYGTPTYGQ